MKIAIYQDENLILQNKDDNFTLKNKQQTLYINF